jgi:hypothetical protein
MVTQAQRLAILARRFALVQEYGALHVERMDLHTQLHALRTNWSATMQANGGTVGPTPLTSAERLALARDLKLLSDRLRDVALRSQRILLEQQMLVQALSEPED